MDIHILGPWKAVVVQFVHTLESGGSPICVTKLGTRVATLKAVVTN